MNNFLTLFLASIIIVSFTIFYIPVYGDVIPPLKQYKLGFSSVDVFCKDGLIKVIKLENKKPACVLPSSAEKLSKSGWATQVDQKLIEDAKIDKPKEIGTLNIIEIDPVDISSGKFKQNPPTAGYNLVFEVCAQQTTIISPEISIRTDSEAKRFTLAVDVPANSCILSTTFVKATNTKSITAQISSTDGVTNTILEFQQKIDEITTNLTNEKNKLNQVQGTQDSAEYKKQISQITENIIKFRKDLNDARDDLYRYQYALVAPTTSVTKTPTKLSYSGTPIEGESVKKLAVLQSLSGEGTYDVLFEACAGKDPIRIPIITVTSDITNQTVKLGEKISPNTCQKTSTKINAKDVNSITVLSQNNLESTNKISELEGQINDLQNQINSERKLLGELIHNPKRPADFNGQLTEITQQITDLRNQILILKSQLHDLLYLNYRAS